MPYLKELCEGLDVEILIDEIPKIKSNIPFAISQISVFSFFAPFHLLAPFFAQICFQMTKLTLSFHTVLTPVSLPNVQQKTKKIRYVPFIHDPAAFILKKYMEIEFLGKVEFLF